MSRLLPATLFSLATLAVPLAPGTARAWDFIFFDQMNVTLCNNGCGITLAEGGWALLVNTGTTNITASELFGASYEVVSTNPDFSLSPFINNPGQPVAPILPNEAVGNNWPELAALVEPGEAIRLIPFQFLAFSVFRNGLSNGPVDFYVAMVMGGERANFIVHANFTSGPHDIAFTHALRVSSVPLPTPVAHTTWGKIKAIYR